MQSDLTKFRNEAAVELRVIFPLLASLGYMPEDISPKHPVVFQEGRAGRKHEADFVLFDGPLHNENTSLLVVEAKAPAEDLDAARRQAESYALATRAPALLTCDGNTLEMWQLNLARSSDRIFSFSVSDIEARRSDIERYMSKEVLAEYGRKVCAKTIVEATADFGSYENAELRRTLPYDRLIDRRLKNLHKKDEYIRGRELLSAASGGAVIMAASGAGKTSLSHKLLRAQIEERWQKQSEHVPVHIPLLDLRPGEPIMAFAAKRLTAYNRSVTEQSIVSILHAQGLTLILDEFDRLNDDERSSRETELRLLLRDHTRLRLFVFSRVAARPALTLPAYELLPLDEEEKLALFQARGTTDAAMVLHIPPLLRELCGNPLLLSLVTAHYEQSGSFPDRIEQIFRTWLDHTIHSVAKSPAAATSREAALIVLALGRRRGRLCATEAVEQLKRAEYAPELLDDLIRCDALALRDGNVSFRHEGLADYLQAVGISRLAPTELNAAIACAEFEEGSLFPVLLAALLDSIELQSLLWERLAHVDFGTYLEMLRYRADVSARMPSADKGLTERFLRDLREGVVLPMKGFFPALGRPLVAELVQADTDNLAVTGAVDSHSATYSFVPPSIAGAFDAKGLIKQGYSLRGVYFAPSGLRLDSGRLLGLQKLRDALYNIIDRRHLPGRIEWVTERLTSRLHYLHDECAVNLAVTDPLTDWRALLAPDTDKAVCSDWPSCFLFSIGSVLDDISFLQSHDRWQLLDDSPRLGDIGRDDFNREKFSRDLAEHYRRMQILYREAVEESFAPIRGRMGFYNALPVRWQVNVIDQGKGASDLAIQHRWLPVTSWEQAGADIEFSGSFMPWQEADFARVKEELQQLGRLNNHTVVSCGRRTLFSFQNFDRHQLRMESSTFRDACNQIMTDVKRLFDDMPSHDCTPSWQSPTAITRISL